MSMSMSIREQHAKEHIEGMIADEARYTFPLFLKKLREGLGLKGIFVAELLKISKTRFFQFQTASIFSAPRKEDLEKISSYYGVPLEFLEKKLASYVPRKKKYPNYKGVKYERIRSIKSKKAK